MFSAILPGLRQVRTPLLAGALYLLALWLTLGPDRFVRGESIVLDRAQQLAHLVGGPTVLSFVALGAYLLGTFFTIHSWPRRALRAQAAYWNIRSFGLRRWYSNLMKPMFAWRGWRPRIIGYQSTGGIDDPHEPVDPFFPLYGYGRADGLGTYMEVADDVRWAGDFSEWLRHRGRRLHKLLTWKDIDASAASEEFRDAVRQAWDESRDFMWRRANNELESRDGTWDSSSVSFSLRKDQIPPWPHVNGKWKRNPEHRWWNIEENADEPIRGYILVEAYRYALDSELTNLLARIRSQNSPVYDDYSRHMSEAELRYSISPPLALNILTVAVGVSALYVFLLAIPVALLRQGFARERQARITILEGLQNSAIESPAFVALEQALETKRQSRLDD